MSNDPFNLDDVLTKYVKKPSEKANPELALLYGRPGCGKSWLAASISRVPGFKKILILDTEGSTTGTISDFDDSKVDIVDCRRDTPAEAFQFLNTILEKLFDSNNKHSYDAVIIDTFDVAQDWAKDYFTATTPKNDRGKTDGFAVFGALKDWSVSVASNLKRIPPMGIMVVHEKSDKDQDGGLVVGLNLVGGAANVIPGIPDTVAYLQRVLENDEEVTYGYFATQDGKVTKNRFKFPPVVKNPSFDKLFKFIEGKTKNG